jgi:hypothetical protein
MTRNYAAERLGSLIAGTLDAEDDPRTLVMWAQAAGVSTRTLQYVCSAAGVPAAACRDLARLVRLVGLTVLRNERWDPFAQLNADPRTVGRLIRHGGLSPGRTPPDLETFIAGQSLVRSSALLQALREHLRSRAAGAAQGSWGGAGSAHRGP